LLNAAGYRRVVASSTDVRFGSIATEPFSAPTDICPLLLGGLN